MKADVAVVGPQDSILAFRAAGADAFDATGETVVAVLRKVVKEYKIVLLIESLLPDARGFLEKFDAQAYPVILAIPGSGGASGEAMRMVRQAGEKALGVDILFHGKNE